ncbi:MAG: alpha/beta hydrolase [Alcanivoracaceae bacterium]|nr:alpha/beta hydrolase [Alcanivoracaceae bacterium]
MKKIVLLLLLILVGLNCSAQTVSIGERVSIYSEILNDNREVLIYKPPSYYFNDSSKYPVLYIMDADYNFHYVTGLIELLSSISENIPEMIVVGVSGKGTPTYRKNSKPPYDVEDKGNADKNFSFIEKELLPYIDQNYKTNDYKVLAGHSIGGLFVTYVMLNHHEVFDDFIAISPSLWWEGEAVKRNTEKEFAQKKQLPTNYYVSLADEQGMGVHGFVELMQSKGPRSLNFKFKYFPDESHGSVGLPTYKWALKDIFTDFRIEGGYFKDAKAVEDYYKLVQEKYKTTFHISAGFLRSTVYAYSRDKDKRLSIAKALEKYFPLQIDEFRNIEISGSIGVDKMDEAKEILKRAVENNKNNFETLANQALLYHKEKKHKKAIKAINEAIEVAKQKKIRRWLMNELLDQRQSILAD